ncbi:radical SAM (seleno)protein TrsS [Cloacibacillus evryensis]|uniref:radical SAM (seleno)protein TrsS n=1 Tax=Cloacibacillus evryensis TaxID=508460 RepID=UPI002673DE5D|nr:radical SAM (seleno)protein TrsS [Cloacibacillus evryensis]
MKKTIRHTYSVCPACGRRLPAEIVVKDGASYLEKSCPVHGDFSVLIWKNRRNLFTWLGDVKPLGPGENSGCPASCAENGLCGEHKNGTCCVVLEVTERCTLHCRYCFADKKNGPDIPFEELRREMAAFVVPGRTLVQLSGGEPTLRDDLPELTAAAKELGCKYVQLNSNGIRLAEDEGFVKKLAAAGLSFVFMQFDGIDDAIYRKLRGAPLFAVKERAIANCAKYNLGVTLVPTIVPGVNDGAVGDILRYAVERSPAVRGVHFQPVAYMGRIPAIPDDVSRFTLDELMCAIEEQSGGLVKAENLQPSQCDHPLCGFHGDFIVKEDGTLYPLTRKREDASCCCCGADSPADKNREFVGRRWQRAEDSCCGGKEAASGDMEDMDYFLARLSSHGFTITSMAFQDAGSLDVERLRMCSLHVAKKGKLVPFCVNYLTLWDGD